MDMDEPTKAVVQVICNWITSRDWAEIWSSPATLRRRGRYKTWSKKSAQARAMVWIHGNETDFFEFTRMNKRLFLRLCTILREQGLTDGKTVSVEEKVLITLQVLSASDSQRRIKRLFSRPGGTVSAAVNEVLPAICSIRDMYIRRPEAGVQPWLMNRRDLLPAFEGAVGAIDGTHIPAIVTEESSFF